MSFLPTQALLRAGTTLPTSLDSQRAAFYLALPSAIMQPEHPYHEIITTATLSGHWDTLAFSPWSEFVPQEDYNSCT